MKMSKPVITVTANADKYDIRFDEKALAKLGHDKTNDIMRALRNHTDAYMDAVVRKTNYRRAKENWKAMHRESEGYVDIPV